MFAERVLSVCVFLWDLAVTPGEATSAARCQQHAEAFVVSKKPSSLSIREKESSGLEPIIILVFGWKKHQLDLSLLGLHGCEPVT